MILQIGVLMGTIGRYMVGALGPCGDGALGPCGGLKGSQRLYWHLWGNGASFSLWLISCFWFGWNHFSKKYYYYDCLFDFGFAFTMVFLFIVYCFFPF